MRTNSAAVKPPPGGPGPAGKKTIRIAVVGSRGYPDLGFVAACVKKWSLWRDRFEIVIVSGTEPADGVPLEKQPGVDQAAILAARALGLETAVHPADWKHEGRRAGPLRNTQIVADCHRLVAFWDGASRGTADSIRKAIGAGRQVGVYDAKGVLLSGPQVAELLRALNGPELAMIDRKCPSCRSHYWTDATDPKPCPFCPGA